MDKQEGKGQEEEVRRLPGQRVVYQKYDAIDSLQAFVLLSSQIFVFIPKTNMDQLVVTRHGRPIK